MKPIDTQVIKEVRPEVPERPGIDIIFACNNGKWYLAGYHDAKWENEILLPYDIIRLPSHSECELRAERAALVAAVIASVRKYLAGTHLESLEDFMDTALAALDAFDREHPEIGGGK